MDFKKLCKIVDSIIKDDYKSPQEFEDFPVYDLYQDLNGWKNHKLANRNHIPVSEDTIKVFHSKYNQRGLPMGTMSDEDWNNTVILYKQAVTDLGWDCEFDDRGENGLFIKIKEGSGVDKLNSRKQFEETRNSVSLKDYPKASEIVKSVIPDKLTSGGKFFENIRNTWNVYLKNGKKEVIKPLYYGDFDGEEGNWYYVFIKSDGSVLVTKRVGRHYEEVWSGTKEEANKLINN